MNRYLNNKIRQIVILILPFLLSSCAVYSTGFNCPDSKGARCMMLSEVDVRVDSGEIENVYLGKKCRGKKCASETKDVPKKALNEVHKVKIIPTEEGVNEYQEGDDLYLR
jgi:hypothetical protein